MSVIWEKTLGDIRLTAPCASQDCLGGAVWRYEAGGVGSYYCDNCKAKIEALDQGPTPMTDMNEMPPNFEQKLSGLLNYYSMENASNTPDFILAEYMIGCLRAYNDAVAKRAHWAHWSGEAGPKE